MILTEEQFAQLTDEQIDELYSQFVQARAVKLPESVTLEDAGWKPWIDTIFPASLTPTLSRSR